VEFEAQGELYQARSTLKGICDAVVELACET
jgi:hypothetical protein